MKHSKKSLVIKEMQRLGYTNPLSREQILVAAKGVGLGVTPLWAVTPENRVSRGLFNIPELDTENGFIVGLSLPPIAQDEQNLLDSNMNDTTMQAVMTNSQSHEQLIPDVNATYIPWGHYDEIAKIISSKKFAPVFVTGLSGNGKTTMIEQICAKQKRQLFRVNITELTDEDDLLGGMRLVNGNTVWQDGAVVKAMECGGVLLLDEVDLGSHKIMCLQPVLEGKGVFLKKTNTWIYPAKGFTVGLTGNTKGRGDETGKFVGTNIMNEAFLDRVPLTIEQEYPKPETETKIVVKIMEQNGEVDQEFAEILVKWADQIRRSYAEGASEEVITTRRLIQAAQGFSIFGNRKKAIEGILTRFDALTQAAFLDLYKKLDVQADGGLNTENLGAAPVAATAAGDNKCPF
jgi:MoxR-like ATPase